MNCEETNKNLCIKLLDELTHSNHKLKEEKNNNNNLHYVIEQQEKQIKRQSEYIDKYIKDVNIINNLVKNNNQYTERIKNIITTNEEERKLKDTIIFQNLYIEDCEKTIEALFNNNNYLREFETIQTEEIKQLKNKINEINN